MTGMRIVIIGCCLAAVVLAAARRVRAAEFSLWPLVELDEIYDNNVKLTPTNTKGDFVTAESFGATLEASTAARNFFLTYQTQMLEYASYGGLDRFGKDHAANLRDVENLTPATTLSISDSFLVGDAVSSGILVNGATPIGPQMMQSLFYQTSILTNFLSLDLSSRYNSSFTWTGNIHQDIFTTLPTSSASSSSSSGVFFDEGGSVGGLWDLPEKFVAGFVCQFDDFRSNNSLPTSEVYWPQAKVGWGEGTPFTILAQVGPIISDTSAGAIPSSTPSGATSTSSVAAQTTVDIGYFVSGSYSTRRLTITASAAQEPGFGAGFVGYSVEQTYNLLASYKLSRRATVFVNGGYYTLSGSGVSANGLIYTAGMTYRLNEYFTLSANYLGFQTKASGSGVVGTLVAVPGQTTTVSLFQAGITFTPPAIKWRL